MRIELLAGELFRDAGGERGVGRQKGGLDADAERRQYAQKQRHLLFRVSTDNCSNLLSSLNLLRLQLLLPAPPVRQIGVGSGNRLGNRCAPRVVVRRNARAFVGANFVKVHVAQLLRHFVCCQ